MSIAANQAIECRDYSAISQILEYSRQHFLLVTLDRESLQLLIHDQEWTWIEELVKYRCQLQDIDCKHTSSLKFSDFIEQTYLDKAFELKFRIKAVLNLQDVMDYDRLAQIIVKRDSFDWSSTGETIFLLLSDKRLSIRNRDIAITEMLIASIDQERYDLAVKIWRRFAIIVTNRPEPVIQAFCTSFERSIANFEFKAFFAHSLIRQISQKSLDRILVTLEKKIMYSRDGSQKPHVYANLNLNLVKFTQQMYALLDLISTKWAKSGLRTNLVKEKLINNTKEYLQNCYHPTEIRMLVLQNDIFGDNTLFYLE